MTMRLFFSLIVLLHSVADAHAQAAQTNQFTLQGRLVQDGEPVDGTRNLSFALFAAATGGAQVGVGHGFTAWPVIDGLFTVDLPFAPPGAGAEAWIEVRVDGTPIQPRLKLPTAPIAQFALTGTAGPQGPPGPQGGGGPPGEPRLLPNVRCPPNEVVDVIASHGATCEPRGISDWRRVDTDFSVANLALEQRTVSCQPGEVVLGGGVEQLQREPDGDASGIEVRIVESFPTFANGRWGWQVAVYNTGLVAPLRAFATCAQP